MAIVSENQHNGNGTDDGNGDFESDVAAYDHPESDHPPQATYHDPASRYRWADVLAPITHTVKYIVDGNEHTSTFRGDNLETVLAQVKILTALVRQAKEVVSVPTTNGEVAVAPVPDAEFKQCPIHDVPMGKGFHKIGEKEDGQAIWCRGRS